jgi:putative flavoprotein involved in K+ transport
MMATTVIVVGAGHAGLAMSRRLSERSIDHVVLERGQVANSWRTQRWPSLRHRGWALRATSDLKRRSPVR